MRALVLTGLLTVLALPQTPPAQNPAPVFRAATRLVQVNVVVHDKHGQPIADLKKEDFTVLERGKPQSIALFSLNDGGTAPAAQALPPHIFSNAVAARSDVPTGVTVLLLDLVNTGFLDQQRAGESVRAFLTQIQPQDRMFERNFGNVRTTRESAQGLHGQRKTLRREAIYQSRVARAAHADILGHEC